MPPVVPPHPSSEQPNIRKNHPHRHEKPQPNPPPDPRLLRHPQHAVHRPPQPDARAVERVVHGVREGGRGADFVADGDGDLWWVGERAVSDRDAEGGREAWDWGSVWAGSGKTHVLQHLHLGAYALQMLVVLVLQLGEHRVAVLTSAHQTSSASDSTHTTAPIPSLKPITNPTHSSRNPPISAPAQTHLPRIRRRAPKPAIDLPHPAPAGPHTTATRPRIAVPARRSARGAVPIAGVGVEEGGAGVALVEGGGAESARGDGHGVLVV